MVVTPGLEGQGLHPDETLTRAKFPGQPPTQIRRCKVKKFRVVTEETLGTVYIVEAEDAEEAEEMILGGDGDELRTDTWNLEVVSAEEESS